MRNYYSKWRSLALFCFLMIAAIGSVRAQVSAYSFNQAPGTYTPITGGTVLGTATNDDTGFNNQPIGFTFTYNNVAYTNFSVQSNGFIAMGATIVSSYTPISGGTTNNIIAAFGNDLQGNGTTATLRYETIGTAPNRILVVQWTNYKKFGGAGTGDDYNFQIRLHETTNVVQVVYGTVLNNANATTGQVGLRGASNADFNNRTTAANWAASTAGGTNAASMTLSAAVSPANGQTYTWVGPPPTPPTPFQVAPTTSCLTGTQLDVVGTPSPGISWYWQTSATGTSLATPYAGPYTVLANGTYYMRAYNTVTLAWSTNSSSYTVSDFPSAPTPPAPVAAVNPSCAPLGTTISVSTPPVGTDYYWQGTTSNGTSTANPATAPFAATSSGTYHVSAFETATGCWSLSSSVAITVDTYVPAAPVASTTSYNICAGETTLQVTTDPYPSSGSVNLSFGTNLQSFGPATNFPATVPALPAGATITSAQLLLTNVNAINGSWRSEIRVALNGMYTLAATQISALTSGGLITPDPVINLAGFPTTGGALNLVLSETFDDGGATTVDATFGDVQLVINYTVPATSTSWYDAASAGNQVGTGSPFETVGTSVLSNPATGGVYEFYAEAVSGGCVSTSRTLVTVNVTDVNAVLAPSDVTCNGGDNGSFTLGTVECGTLPFTYSIDGGAFGAIPTDLTAGTYTVIIEDDNGLQSAPITVVVGQPAAPSNITVSNILYFTADVSWTTTGDETSWTVEYGPAGFTPGSGTVINATSTSVSLTGLTEDTQYDVYVTADCAPNPEAGGPATFSTNEGFFTYDNSCGPGFIDISGTGTEVFIVDEDFAGATIPFAFEYQGTTVTDVTINDNGTLIFGTQTGYSGFNNAAIGAATPTGVYPFWDDLDGANVYYETVGTAPNQLFIVQWQNRPLWPGVAGQDITFQVILEEATGEIYFIYNDAVFGGSQAGNDNGGSATIGVAGPLSDVQVSFNSPTYLQENSCVHFYNALCPNPLNVTVQAFQEDIILDWDAGPYGETEWTIIYGLAGFDPAVPGEEIGIATDIFTSDATFSGLSQLTDYDFYIYSECTADNLTSGGLLVEATTLPWCADPTVLGGTTVVDSLFATWNWTAAVGAPNALSAFNLSYGAFGTADAYAGTELVANGLDNNDTIADPNFLGSGVYQVWVQAVCGADTSNYVGPFTFVMPLSNDTVCGAEMLNVDGTVYYFNNVGATVDGIEPSVMPSVPPGIDGYNGTDLPMMTWGEGTPDGTTWYSFVAPPSGSIRFNGEDQNFFGSQIAIYDVVDCGDYTTFELVAASDQTDAAVTTKVAPDFTICGLTPGSVYYVMHEAWFGNFDQYSIKLTPIVLEAGSYVDILDVCSGSSVNLMDGITGYDNGGIWTAEIAAAGTGITDSTFSSAGLAYQVFNFEYRVTDGCAYDSITSQVEIWAPSSAGDDGTITVCRNEPFDLLSGLGGTVDMGGTWYDPGNNALPSSAITASNIPGQFNFDYVVTNGICPNDTALVLVNVSSSCDYLNVQEMVFADMTVYPNPSNGVFNIANEGTEVFSFEVTDIEGRVILSKEAAINGTTVTEIDLTGKVTGVYMIRVYNDTAEKVFRVVLQ